jgi:hypothetical protein
MTFLAVAFLVTACGGILFVGAASIMSLRLWRERPVLLMATMAGWLFLLAVLVFAARTRLPSRLDSLLTKPRLERAAARSMPAKPSIEASATDTSPYRDDGDHDSRPSNGKVLSFDEAVIALGQQQPAGAREMITLSTARRIVAAGEATKEEVVKRFAILDDE